MTPNAAILIAWIATAALVVALLAFGRTFGYF